MSSDERTTNPDKPAAPGGKGSWGNLSISGGGGFSGGGGANRAGGQPEVPVEVLFERAVREHMPRLLAVARGIVGTRGSAEDVVQQAFTNLYEHRARYDWREPGGLLRRAVINESLRLLRQPRLAPAVEDLPGHGETPLGEIMENETVSKVRQAIEQLPEHFRAALVLCEYENMPYTEIAETLGASVPQVKTWLFRARRQLAARLKDFMDAKRATE